jgi:membrane protease YdiL (CAAX protease family)
MEGLITWLQNEATGIEIFYVCFVVLAIGFAYNISMLFLSRALFGRSFARFSGKSVVKDILKYPFWSMIILLFSVIAIEEAVFRLLPLSLSVWAWGPSTAVIVVAVIFSVIFGLCHGKIRNVLFQGVSGFLFAVVFLKCGGFQGHYFKAFLISTLVHAVFVGICLLFASLKRK